MRIFTMQRNVIVVSAFCFALLGASAVHADKTGAFLGGMVTAKVLSNMSERTEAEKQQAYYAQQQAQQQAQPVPQAAPAQTAEQKLAELDKLAANGYITPDEYKAKKQQILDSM